MSAAEIGELSVKLANAALIARGRGDDVKAILRRISAGNRTPQHSLKLSARNHS
jgi:hypothetical protein